MTSDADLSSKTLEPSRGYIPQMPAFLRQSKSELRSKFVDLEWQQRKRLAEGQQNANPVSQWARVSGDEVLLRNRYLNVDPYLSNRIRLRVPEGHSDYINASPILLKSTKDGSDRKYIATQGPKETHFSHIWRMIYHETSSPAAIVMLTQTHEAGKEKCFQYFPPDLSNPTLRINEHDEFRDDFKSSVTLLDVLEDNASRSTVRKLLLSTDGGEKVVWHLLFSGWPDFLVPEGDDKLALLELVKLSSAKNNHDKQNPRVVHCSAGVGRSGTFIALDYLLSELEDGALDTVPDSEDRIAETVDALRKQRMMMVQGEAQFHFLYEVLREQWLERHKGRESKVVDEEKQSIVAGSSTNV